MQISDQIREVEQLAHPAVYARVRDAFSRVHLPSHDETHHERVWKYMKHLLEVTFRDQLPGRGFVMQAFYACFFHDLGMSIDPGPLHGTESRRMLMEYLGEAGLDPIEFLPALSAVEKHDDKSYAATSNLLRSLLGMADDLDAFGGIGIIRYTEIYLVRDIPLEELPGKVLKNIDQRYRHLAGQLPGGTTWIREQEKRYRYARQFFLDLASGKKDASGQGPSGVVRLVEQEVLGNKLSYKELCDRVIQTQTNPFLQYFFQQVMEELEAGQA